MTTNYTKNVRKAILKVAKHCKKIIDVEAEDNLWLGTAKGTSKDGTYFVSDVTITLKGSKVLIVQLCDSQSQDQKKVYGDFFTAFLSREVNKLYFIVPKEKEEDINKICRISTSILKNRKKLDKTRILNWKVFPVKKDSYDGILKEIKALAISENWGYFE